jgi:hypothetical protein
VIDIGLRVSLSRRVSEVVPEPARVYHRHPHDKELRAATVKADPTSTDRVYRGAATGEARPMTLPVVPEVYQILPQYGVTPLSAAWVDFVCELNYELPRETAMKIFDPHWAFNNGRELPGWDKPRVCGGALLSGAMDGRRLMIDYIDTGDPVPDVQFVLDRPWLWFYGTQVAQNGNVSFMTLGVGDGVRIPVRVPLLYSQPVYLPTSWLHRLPAGPADPLRFGG